MPLWPSSRHRKIETAGVRGVPAIEKKQMDLKPQARILENAYSSSNTLTQTCNLVSQPYAILERVINGSNVTFVLLGYSTDNLTAVFQGLLNNSSSNNNTQMNNGTTRRLGAKTYENNVETTLAWQVPHNAASGDHRVLINMMPSSGSNLLYGSSNNVQLNSLFNLSDQTAAAAKSHGIFVGQECQCASISGFYCPTGTAYCSVVLPHVANTIGDFVSSTTSSSSSFVPIVTCTGPRQDDFMRYVFPMEAFLLLLFTILLFFSVQGKYARGFLRKVICLCDRDLFNRQLSLDFDRIVELSNQRLEIIQRMRMQSTPAYFAYNPNNELAFLHPDIHPVYISYLTSQRLERQRQAQQQQRPSEITVSTTRHGPREVVLRTRRYRQPKNHWSRYGPDNAKSTLVKTNDNPLNENDEGSELSTDDDSSTDGMPCCSICLVNYRQGDRITNLDCGHVYHVDCIKSWIVRKNHCPLCKVRFATRPQGESDEANANDNDEAQRNANNEHTRQENNENGDQSTSVAAAAGG